MNRGKMFKWLEKVKSKKFAVDSSSPIGKNRVTPWRAEGGEKIDFRKRCASMSLAEEDAESELFEESSRHRFVEIELPRKDPEDKEEEVTEEAESRGGENWEDEGLSTTSTKIQSPDARASREKSSESGSRSPAKRGLSSCKKVIRKLLKSPGKGRLFSSPGKKTKLVNEEATDAELSELRASNDSGYAETSSSSWSISSLPPPEHHDHEEDEAYDNFCTSSPLVKDKDSSRLTPFRGRNSMLKSVVKSSTARTILKFQGRNDSGYSTLNENLSPFGGDLSAFDPRREIADATRRKSDSDIFVKTTTRSRRGLVASVRRPEVGKEVDGLRDPRRFEGTGSLDEFFLSVCSKKNYRKFENEVDEVKGEPVNAEGGQKVEEALEVKNNSRVGENCDGGLPPFGCESSSTSSRSEFFYDSLEDSDGGRNEEILSRGRQCSRRIGGRRGQSCFKKVPGSNSAPDLSCDGWKNGEDSESDPEHSNSVDNLSGVFSREETREDLVHEAELYGTTRDELSRSFSCLEDDFTIDVNDYPYTITMYI